MARSPAALAVRSLAFAVVVEASADALAASAAKREDVPWRHPMIRATLAPVRPTIMPLIAAKSVTLPWSCAISESQLIKDPLGEGRDCFATHARVQGRIRYSSNKGFSTTGSL